MYTKLIKAIMDTAHLFNKLEEQDTIEGQKKIAKEFEEIFNNIGLRISGTDTIQSVKDKWIARRDTS